MSIEPVGENLHIPGRNYECQPHEVRVLLPEDLVKGSVALGIQFEFWENLVLRYLKDPNYHDLAIKRAVREGPGGLTLEEFTNREILYLSLTSVLKQEETIFFEECVAGRFESYSEHFWGADQPYPLRRFATPDYRFVQDRTEHYLFSYQQTSPELYTEIGESDCVFHEPKEFRRCHRAVEWLTLDCCRGVSTRRLPVTVDSSYHLAWIAEYANACEPCQAEADQVLREFALRGLNHHHRPRFHPAYFLCKRTPFHQWRDVRYLYFFTNLQERLQNGTVKTKDHALFENRPTKCVLFTHIIEQHVLEIKEALGEREVLAATSTSAVEIEVETSFPTCAENTQGTQPTVTSSHKASKKRASKKKASKLRRSLRLQLGQ